MGLIQMFMLWLTGKGAGQRGGGGGEGGLSGRSLNDGLLGLKCQIRRLVAILQRKWTGNGGKGETRYANEAIKTTTRKTPTHPWYTVFKSFPGPPGISLEILQISGFNTKKN